MGEINLQDYYRSREGTHTAAKSGESGVSDDARYIVKHLWIVAVVIPIAMSILAVLISVGLK
jgi:hypothetical protein